MKSILIVILLSLVSAFAFAADPAKSIDEMITAQQAECEQKHPGDLPAQILTRNLCKQGVAINGFKIKIKSDAENRKAFEAELRRMREEQVKTTKAIEALAKAAEAARQAAEKAKADKPVPVQQPAPPAGLMPAPPMSVPIEAPYVAATFDLFAGNPLSAEIYAINSGAEKWFNIHGQMRVLAFKNGQPLSIAHRGPVEKGGIRYVDTYVDLDRDGQLDPIPMKGFDPMLGDSLYVGYQPGDEIQLVYLVPIKMQAVPGLPPQIVWGNPKKLVFHDNSASRNNTAGRAQFSARCGDPAY